MLTMEWIDGLRCTDPRAIVSSGINVEEFIRGGVVTGLRQLLEVGGVLGLRCCRKVQLLPGSVSQRRGRLSLAQTAGHVQCASGCAASVLWA